MQDQLGQQNLNTGAEYPYQPLYRPWSWALSTLSNFFLFALVFLAVYVVYRRQRKLWQNGGRSTVSYRKVDMRQGEEGKTSVLVMGAEGCFGSHLVQCLLADGGYNVYCLDSYIPLEENRNAEVCAYIQADVCSYEDMLLLLRGVEAVFHAASLSPHHSVCVKKADFYHTNVTGTENVIRVCKECNVKRLIYTSSATVVVGKKWNQQNADESTPYPKSPLNVYTGSLVAAEELVLNSTGKDGLTTCAMRLAPFTCSIRDPTMESLLSQNAFLLKAADHGVTIVGADVAARAHVLAERKLRDGSASVVAGKAYNLGNKERVLYSDLVGKLASDEKTIWGQSPPTEISKWALFLLAYINYYCCKMTGALLVDRTLSPLLLDAHTTEQSFSSARARRDLGWEEQRAWQEIVQGLVHLYKTKQEVKKNQ